MGVINDFGNAVMHFVARHGDAAMKRLLIAHGASADSCSRIHGSIAANCINIAVLQVLLEYNAEFGFNLGTSILHGSHHINAEAFGTILEHCRNTMTEAMFGSLLLQTEMPGGNTELHPARSVEHATLLVEQPRGPDNQLLSTCHIIVAEE